MVDDGTHAAGGVAAAEWLAATLGVGDVTAGGNDPPGGSGDGEDCDDVDRGVTHARLHDDAQSDDDDDAEADILEAILGHVGRREDAGYDDEGVDVSVDVGVGVGVGAVVGVGVHGQGVSLGDVLGVGLVLGPPHLTSLDA